MIQEYYVDPKFKKMESIKMALFFPVFGVLIYLISKEGIGDMIINLILIIAIGTFGIWQVIKYNKPSIIINDTGLIIKIPLEFGVIKWAEIKGVRIEKSLKNQILCIDLKDSIEHKSRLPKILRKQAQASEPNLKTHIAIMGRYISYQAEELKSKIEEKIK